MLSRDFGGMIMAWLFRAFFFLLTALLLPAALVVADEKKPQTIDTMVAMHDGIELATTVYLPEGSGPFPVVVARTPYNKDGQKSEAAKFVRNGYAYVAQDL